MNEVIELVTGAFKDAIDVIAPIFPFIFTLWVVSLAVNMVMRLLRDYGELPSIFDLLIDIVVGFFEDRKERKLEQTGNEIPENPEKSENAKVELSVATFWGEFWKILKEK